MRKQKPAKASQAHVARSQARLKWTLGIVVALTGFLLYDLCMNKYKSLAGTETPKVPR